MIAIYINIRFLVLRKFLSNSQAQISQEIEDKTEHKTKCLADCMSVGGAVLSIMENIQVVKFQQQQQQQSTTEIISVKWNSMSIIKPNIQSRTLSTSLSKISGTNYVIRATEALFLFRCTSELKSFFQKKVKKKEKILAKFLVTHSYFVSNPIERQHWHID